MSYARVSTDGQSVEVQVRQLPVLRAENGTTPLLFRSAAQASKGKGKCYGNSRYLYRDH
jgi:hypothetical protein